MTRTKAMKKPRRAPVQERSKHTVESVLEAAARVFTREGFGATTNRIARLAGVSIGTLYEYFPNKQHLLLALAERHLAEAERGIHALLMSNAPNRVWLPALQNAILASHRYPSQAVDLAAAKAGPALLERAEALRLRVLEALTERARASGRPAPEVRARIVFSLIGELTSRSAYQALDAGTHTQMLQQLLELALEHLGDPRD